MHIQLYFRSVPRWVPKWRGLVKYLRHIPLPYYEWANVMKREQSTLQGLVMGCIAMIMKEYLS